MLSRPKVGWSPAPPPPALVKVLAKDLKPRDFIHGQDAIGRTTYVEEVEVSPAGCRYHTHVNRNQCYDSGQELLVRRAEPVGASISKRKSEMWTGR